jgi:hypothetical protein
MTQKWTKEQIKRKLATDDRWLMRGILALYRFQTAEEQRVGATTENNGMGFNGVDAEILTSFALQIQRSRYLSPKQLEIARKKMDKYAGQLTKVANGKL